MPDFNKAYYEDLYFGEGEGVASLKSYYEQQSSGRYSVDGEVAEVVTVPFNEARYGRSNGFRARATSVTTPGSWSRTA